MFFRNKLNRTSISKDVKKQVDATIDILYTVVKGHWVACACEILGIPDSEGIIKFPADIHKANPAEQRQFVESIAKEVVDRLTLISSAFLNPGKTADSEVTHATIMLAYCATMAAWLWSFVTPGQKVMVEEC